MNKYKINTEKIIDNIFIISSVLIIILLIIYSIKSDNFNINNVNINNNDFLTNDEIEGILNIELENKNIFNINISELKKSINKHNYIRSSKIYTTYPNNIFIHINEIIPIVLFEENSQYFLIDHRTNKIKADIKALNYYSVPIISINEFNSTDIYKIVNTLKYITVANNKLYNSIDEIIIEKEFSYIIVNNTKIKLNKNNIENDIFKFVQFINDTQDSKDINRYKYVNVTVPNQIIVKERKM